jgi:hypothetical protein
VFVDGLVPQAGQSCFDLMPGARNGFVAEARSVGSDWSVPAPPPGYFGIVDPADVAWATERLTPMPLRTHDEPLAAAPPSTLPGLYLRCDGFGGFDAQMQPAIERGCSVEHLPDGHDVQITNPTALTDLLLSI